MELGNRLGIAGLIVALLGLGITILYPTKRWIGYVCFIFAGILGVYWGISEYQARTHDHLPSAEVQGNNKGNPTSKRAGVDFHMPPGGWMTEWGSRPPDIAFAVADATQFVPYKDHVRLMLIWRIADDAIDEQQDENIQKSPLFTPAQPVMSMEMHIEQRWMRRLADYPPSQLVHMALVLITADIDPRKIRKLADVQALGGQVLVVNGFGMNVKTHLLWEPNNPKSR
jgi:hypothetical protein